MSHPKKARLSWLLVLVVVLVLECWSRSKRASTTGRPDLQAGGLGRGSFVVFAPFCSDRFVRWSVASLRGGSSNSTAFQLEGLTQITEAFRAKLSLVLLERDDGAQHGLHFA